MCRRRNSHLPSSVSRTEELVASLLAVSPLLSGLTDFVRLFFPSSFSRNVSPAEQRSKTAV